MTIKIRFFENGDEKGLSKVLNECFKKDYRPYVKFNEKYIKEKVADKRNKIFVAVDKKKIIGSVRVKIFGLDLAELRQISVIKKYRGKGIGTKLIKNAISFLKRKKVRKVVARAKSNDKIGMKFLIDNDFRPESFLREHYKKKVDIIEFALFLR